MLFRSDNIPISARSIVVKIMDFLRLGHSAKPMTLSQWKGDMSIAAIWSFAVPRVVTKPLLLVYWLKPIVGWYKLNTDAS